MEASNLVYPPIAVVPITRRKYKLVLRSDQIAKPSNLEKFWEITHSAARAARVGIRERGKPLETRLREVEFLDTPQFQLYNKGFILRDRSVHSQALPQAIQEVTLKFRHPDRDRARLRSRSISTTSLAQPRITVAKAQAVSDRARANNSNLHGLPSSLLYSL